MPIPQFDTVHVAGDTLIIEGPMPFDVDVHDQELPFAYPPVIVFSIAQDDVVLYGEAPADAGRWHGERFVPKDATLTPGKEALCAGVAIICRSRPGAPAFEVVTWSESKVVTEGVLTTRSAVR